jgi:release factor glutamine methyltransferase
LGGLAALSGRPCVTIESDVTATLRSAGCVFAEDEARLLLAATGDPAELAVLVARRVAGLPLEQVLGWAEFYGLRIAVEPGVFVPRRRTELLARTAIGLAGSAGPAGGSAGRRVVVVDLCCGSGAVAAAISVAVPRAQVHAADLDPVAARCAARNLAATGGRAHHGDLYAALPVELAGRVDLLTANAPYVPSDAVGLMPPEARLHEPRLALDGGPDGLAVLRRVIAGAPRWLAPGGHVLVETSVRQAPLAVAAVTAAGLIPRVEHSDDLDATIVVGTVG